MNKMKKQYKNYMDKNEIDMEELENLQYEKIMVKMKDFKERDE